MVLNRGSIFKITGALSMIYSLTLILPALISMLFHDGELWDFVISLAIFLGGGFFLYSLGSKHKLALHRRDGFIIVVLFWIMLSAMGTVPFLFALNISFVDAFFESASGLTTTGATVLSNLDSMPESILFYRQQLQWLGGMGLIVLAVAVLPVLGIGGMSIYRAESPGPMKEERMTPRLAKTARYLWSLYISITLLCALAYWWVGMTPFDAVAHSMSTVSTGGFSTHDASLAFYDSKAVEVVAMIFMLAGAINFSVHYLVWRRYNPLSYLRDIEVRSFLIIVMMLILFTAVSLHLSGFYESIPHALRESAFEVISVITSTGFGLDDFSVWPLFLPALLILSSFIGGCGGSTAGGMKVMRLLVLLKFGHREMKMLMHPHGLFQIKLGRQKLDSRVLRGISGFFAIYILTFVFLMLMLMATGVDQISAFSGIATCINNLGPGLGEVAYSFSTINDAGKLISVAAMLLGRLEIMSVMVLLHPAFWK
jgi:trk system potassium uptake protein TrkH